MKLSFSLPSKQSSSKPKSSQDSSSLKPQAKHEYLTEFDPSKTPIQQSNEKKLVIPPKQNEWRPAKKMKNLDLPPLHSGGKTLEFEPESSDIVAPENAPQISYGLNLRQSANSKDDSDAHNSVDAILLKKLKTDLDRLPEEEGFDQFNEIPVEDFAEALMAGYGWKKGMGIGRNAKEDVKVVEYKRKTAKEGLGFTDAVPVPVPNVSGDDGSKKSGEEERKDRNLSFGVGKEVRIIGGRDMGMKGRVVEVLSGGGSLVLKLSRSEKEVKVGANEVAELGSLEEDKCLKKLKELKIQGSKEDSRRIDKKGKDSSSERKESKRGREEGRGGDSGEVKHERVQLDVRRSSNKVSWLRSHIRVRVISKSFKGGRFYLKKGRVVDVVGPRMCDISMDEGRELVQGVEQDILETALPKRGGPVLVLLGKHKGAYGSLVERDKDKETGVVQDADSRELLHVRLEQIAEYAGDPNNLQVQLRVFWVCQETGVLLLEVSFRFCWMLVFILITVKLTFDRGQGSQLSTITLCCCAANDLRGEVLRIAKTWAQTLSSSSEDCIIFAISGE